MNRLLLGTRNEGKIQETKDLLAGVAGLEILTFSDAPFSDVPETGRTFLENALLKASAISRETGLPVLSEDAGLEVRALDGAPGVISARFAGEPSNPDRNNKLLLQKLKGVTDRRARFVTVAALCLQDGQTFVCSGVFPGFIAEEPSGNMGFGYDPLFIPSGERRTLAEMTLEEKNRVSHRHKALSRMIGILQDLIRTEELTSIIK
ncbi:RdgB/HAM1 family non-canonical purine NTP pyrophosphatase [Candidatus Bipolaricaulota bacterium]|nr:RdgB/HAM1 family non-canonical purine NTP pyrophosphatase [Candidatus Bipolaricaulota bacterium]